MSTRIHGHSWWQTGIIYEVYVRSFQDSDGDGIGDLAGLRQRLDYLHWLGIDILWLTPAYTSPQHEFGYDIANYTDIDPLFGGMAEFDAFLRDAHAREMKVVLDIAPNHTSSEHPWFTESRSSLDNPKRDWYIWRDPAPGGGPPNNWVSAFGGTSAWELDPATGQYYYHAFLKEQPDLNWHNPEVERAMFECFRFWLRKGVDGFRVDVMWHLLKDKKLRDNPANPDYDPKTMPSNNVQRSLYNADRPEVIEVVLRMRDVLQEFDGERLMIGELYHSGDALVDYYGPGCDAAQMPHNQQLILLPWEAPKLRDAIEQYMASLPEGCWPNWVLSNHDKPRIATRVKSPEQARVARMLLLMLHGTPTLYYGDEIGMTNVDIPKEKLRDPFEKLDPGRGQGRDGQRTPMQWDATANAGFTTGEPWLPVAPDYDQVNVEAQRSDPASMLMLTKSLIELRRKHPALSVGEHRLILTDVKGPVIAFRREHGVGAERETFIIALNLSDKPASFDLPYAYEKVQTVLSTLTELPPARFERKVELRASEGLILRA